jgi:hypothetical protein
MNNTDTGFRTTLVSIDDGPHFEALIEPTTWNGFACPWFTHEVAYQVMEDYVKMYEDVNGISLAQFNYEAIDDTFSYRNHPDEVWEECPTFTENGVTYYGIGNGSWVWQEKQSILLGDDDCECPTCVACAECGKPTCCHH